MKEYTNHGSLAQDYYFCFCDPSRPWSMVGCPYHGSREQRLKKLLQQSLSALDCYPDLKDDVESALRR